VLCYFGWPKAQEDAAERAHHLVDEHRHLALAELGVALDVAEQQRAHRSRRR